MRILKAITTALLLGATAGAASAADLPRKAPSYVAPSYYDWTGFYIGANAGYGWSTNFLGNPKGFVGGGQVGYNWQTGNIVFGLEGDFQYTSLKSSTDLGGGITGTARVPAFGTARGRLGYAFDRFMVYGTGGFAYTKTEASITDGVNTVSDNKWSSGYALGGGLEFALWDRWTAKAEYMYVRSGNVSLVLPAATFSGNYSLNIARAGLNYRF